MALISLLVAVAAPGAAGSSQENASTFRDAAGEDAAAPDIMTVRVSNDDAGLITFRIATPNRPSLREDLRLSIYFDTDDNPRTGLTGSGVDARLLYDVYLHGDPTLWLLRCSGTICSSRGGTKIPLSYLGGPTFTIDRSELGDTRRFRFRIAAMDGVVFDPVTRAFDLANAHGDTAPGDPAKTWKYEVAIGPRRLLVQRFSTTPATPVAGGTFVARLQVKRADTGATVRSGRIKCKATSGGSALRLRRRGFAGGAALCAWAVPDSASGELLRGSIAVTFAGRTATRAFAKRVS
ncbi:MAG TPA: hypothetical protein VFR32_06625 [Gaiellaceae bacterium]|nr:hypothetical protein [Gaiellaceae bacterium]